MAIGTSNQGIQTARHGKKERPLGKVYNRRHDCYLKYHEEFLFKQCTLARMPHPLMAQNGLKLLRLSSVPKENTTLPAIALAI